MNVWKLFFSLLVIITVLGVATASLLSNANEDEDVSIMLSSRNKQIEACRAAAVVLLEGLESNRNALANPEEWRRSGFCPPNVKAFKDLRFDDALVQFEEMTYEERLLVWGYPADSDPAGTLMIRMLDMIAYAQYQLVDRTTPDLLWMQNAPVWPVEDIERRLAMLISPVTGKLIEVDCEEFSAGNAYVRVVTEDEVKELVQLDPSVDEWWNYATLAFGKNDPKDIRVTLTGKEVKVGPYALPGKHRPYLVYVRLYGENGVLIEGLF
jgi:hypothetical protein